MLPPPFSCDPSLFEHGSILLYTQPSLFHHHCEASVHTQLPFGGPWTLFLPSPTSLFHPLCFLRCGPRRAGEALHPEATTVLRSFRLPVRPTERPEMEGSQAGGAERNGGVHHPQQECHHRAHLPRGGAHGQWSWRGLSLWFKLKMRVKLRIGAGCG